MSRRQRTGEGFARTGPTTPKVDSPPEKTVGRRRIGAVAVPPAASHTKQRQARGFVLAFAGDSEPAVRRLSTEANARVRELASVAEANDETSWDSINDVVQQEPVGADDEDTLDLLAPSGIVKGRPFAPDQRMRAILADAVRVGNATARRCRWTRDHSTAGSNTPIRPGSTCCSRAATHLSSTPTGHHLDRGVAGRPSDGARKLNARTAFAVHGHRHHRGSRDSLGHRG